MLATRCLTLNACSMMTTMMLTLDKEFDLCCVILVLLSAVYHNSLCQQNYLLHQAVVLHQLLHGKSFWMMVIPPLKLLLNVVIPPIHCLRHHCCKRGDNGHCLQRGSRGLLLFYLGSIMSYKHLCLIFGITPSAFSCIINKMLVRLVNCLCFHPYACVKFPDEKKMQQFANMVELC
jgi:hypothetical protein